MSLYESVWQVGQGCVGAGEGQVYTCVPAAPAARGQKVGSGGRGGLEVGDAGKETRTVRQFLIRKGLALAEKAGARTLAMFLCT